MKYKEYNLLFDALSIHGNTIPKNIQTEEVNAVSTLKAANLFSEDGISLNETGIKAAERIHDLVVTGDWGSGRPFDKRGISPEPERMMSFGDWICGSMNQETYRTNTGMWMLLKKWPKYAECPTASPEQKKVISKTIKTLPKKFPRNKTVIVEPYKWRIDSLFEELISLKSEDDSFRVTVQAPYIDFVLSHFKKPTFEMSEHAPTLMAVRIANRAYMQGIVAFIGTWTEE